MERGRELVAVEVKRGHRGHESDILNLQRCAEDLKEKLRLSVILYSGTEIVPFSPQVIAIPFAVFFGIER
jgi:hypothetical protein